MTLLGVSPRPFFGQGLSAQARLEPRVLRRARSGRRDSLPIPVVRSERYFRALYEMLDGLLLPRGADVEPQRYGESPRDDAHLNVMPELMNYS